MWTRRLYEHSINVLLLTKGDFFFCFVFSYINLNHLFKFFLTDHSTVNLINWSIKETWKRDCGPVQTAGWFNGCTLHPVFELAAYSIHTKLGYYPPDWLVSLLFSFVLVHWYPSQEQQRRNGWREGGWHADLEVLLVLSISVDVCWLRFHTHTYNAPARATCIQVLRNLRGLM